VNRPAPLGAGGLCYTSPMSPKVPQLKKQQLDLIDKSLKMVWVVAIGAALVLVVYVVLLARNTPPPLGEQVPVSASQSASQ
jgi:hypothetical protein